jgi:hypothetical protein
MVGLGLLVFILIVICFASGLAKIPDPAQANVLGLTIGFSSAFCWGISVIGSPMWNSWFNLFAAAFAALSLGYLAPLELREFLHSLAARLQ